MILAYFKSKAELQKALNAARTDAGKYLQKYEDLDSRNDDLDRHVRNLEYGLEFRDKAIADLTARMATEQATWALEKEVILRSAVALAPKLFELATRA